jgi:2-methylcitrate dehydratase PrpD
MPTTTPLEDLAAWASEVTAADVPDAEHRRARFRILDTLGLVAAAANHPMGQSLAAWADADSGAGAHVLITGASASPAVAALVHGSLAHARDFDDSFVDSVVHPGSIVIAATLAAAERADASFDAITTALTVGYEIAGRLGAVAGRAFHARGFHATGVVGPIAAAGAAGQILALDGAAMADALGLATSMSSGLLAFLADGGWSKWLHTGWSAHGGIVAAELARRGFRGPHHALDHPYGLYGAFLGTPSANLEALTTGLGKTWRGAAALAKSFPCAHVIQPYIEAVLALRAEELLPVEGLQSIRCVMAPWALPIVAVPRATKIAPRNDLEAIASLPFMVAAALCDGRVDLATLGAETLGRADILSIAAITECVGDDILGSEFDGRMEVELRDGRRVSRRVALSESSEVQIVAKYRANTAHLPSDGCARLEHALLNDAPRGRALVQLTLDALVGQQAPPLSVE